MKTHAVLTCLILIAGSSGLQAGADDAVRNWTDWNGKTFRATIAGFDLASFTVSTKAGSVEIDGSPYKSLPAQRRKLVDTVLDDEGFANPGDALAKGGGKPREFNYITVRFLTEAGREVKLPLELLRGAEDGTGDYRIAADKSLEWLKQREADRKREAGESDRPKDNSEAQRRRVEQQQREDAIQWRWAHSRRHRHHHPDYWRERERREQLERQRKELANREAQLKERERKQKEEQAKKTKPKQDPPKKAPPTKDKAKKDKAKKDPPKKNPPKKNPPKKDPPKKDQSKKPDSN